MDFLCTLEMSSCFNTACLNCVVKYLHKCVVTPYPVTPSNPHGTWSIWPASIVTPTETNLSSAPKRRYFPWQCLHDSGRPQNRHDMDVSCHRALWTQSTGLALIQAWFSWVTGDRVDCIQSNTIDSSFWRPHFISNWQPLALTIQEGCVKWTSSTTNDLIALVAEIAMCNVIPCSHLQDQGRLKWIGDGVIYPLLFDHSPIQLYWKGAGFKRAYAMSYFKGSKITLNLGWTHIRLEFVL